MFFKFIFPFFKDKRFLICFGVFAALLLIASYLDMVYTFFVPPIAFILALCARAVWAGISSVVTVATTGARVKKIADKYPQLAEFEKRRSRFVGMRLIFVISVIVAVVAVPMASYYYIEEIMYENGAIAAIIAAAVALVASLIVHFAVINPKKNALNADFKKYAVIEELCLVFNDVKYEPHDCIPQTEINSLKLFRRYDKMTGNDLFEAERGGVMFSRSDLNLSIEHSVEDRIGMIKTTYEKVFVGSVFRFDSGENYSVRLQIASEGFPHVQGDGILSKLLGRTNEKAVETEMDEFNRMFNVYCEDQTAARVILTPQVIEGISRFGKLVKYPVAIVLMGQYIYLLLSTPDTDSFEMCLAGNKSVQQQQETIMAQTAFFASVVDNMYLKNRPRGENSIPLANTPGTANQMTPEMISSKALGRAGGPAMLEGPRRIIRFFRKYPRSVLLLIFFATCVYALFMAPDGMALIFNDMDGVPVIPYTLIVGGIMALFTFFEAGRGRKKKGLSSWGAVILIFLFHLYVFVGSM